MKEQAWLSWSTGKDSAYTLFQMQQLESESVTALVTTVNSDYERVAMHSTRIELLERQALAVGIPLKVVNIPKDCSNETYEESFRAAMKDAVKQKVSKMAFGDLFLEDIKSYREKMFEGFELEPVFPIWQKDTTKLARRMIDLGFEAYLTCVDPKQLPHSFAGRKFDSQLLKDLPDDVDPCGENGEFHTFVFNGPNFKSAIDCTVGDVVERDGFVFAEIIPQ